MWSFCLIWQMQSVGFINYLVAKSIPFHQVTLIEWFDTEENILKSVIIFLINVIVLT